METQHFLFGFNLSFDWTCCYRWENEHKASWRIAPEALEEGWERTILKRRKTVSLKLPCHPDMGAIKGGAFRYIGTRRKRRRKSLILARNERHAELQSFLQRFSEEGNLCLGKRYAWAADAQRATINGVFLAVSQIP